MPFEGRTPKLGYHLSDNKNNTAKNSVIMDKFHQHTAVLFVIHKRSLKLNFLIKTKTNFLTCLPDVRALWRQLVTLLKNKIDFQLPIKMKIFS